MTNLETILFIVEYHNTNIILIFSTGDDMSESEKVKGKNPLLGTSSLWKGWGVEVVSKFNAQFQNWLMGLETSNGLTEIFDHFNGIPKTHLKYIASWDKQITLLNRSYQMDQLIYREAEKVINSYENQFTRNFTDHYIGLIYFVYSKFDGISSVLYVGICHRDGRDNNLNANLHLNNTEFFCRWGDDFARHIGGLSNAVFHNGYPEEQKYFRFANTLFSFTPESIKLKFPVFFQIYAVQPREILLNVPVTSLDELEVYFIQHLNPLVNSIGFD